MKLSMYILSGLLISQSVIADNGQYSRQSIWKDITMSSPELGNVFNGYRTDRGTLRMRLHNKSITVPFSLKIASSKKTTKDWTAICKNDLLTDKFKDFGGIVLTAEINPFAVSTRYQIQEPEGTTETTWYQIENAPEVLGLKLTVEGNEFSSTSDYHEEGYANYLKKVESELSEQFQLQKDLYLAGRPLKFSMNTETLRVFACDLTLNWSKVSLNFSLKAESSKTEEHRWISKIDLTKLYQDLSTKVSVNKKLNHFQAGLLVGTGLGKLEAPVEIFSNERDSKLLDGLFKKDASDSKLLVLKNLSVDGILKVYADLPEQKLPEGPSFHEVMAESQNIKYEVRKP